MVVIQYTQLQETSYFVVMGISTGDGRHMPTLCLPTGPLFHKGLS